MENKQEPLMSFNDWIKINPYIDSPIENYTNYATQWHLNNAKEFVVNETDVYVGITAQDIEQSIHTAIDNYIEINL